MVKSEGGAVTNRFNISVNSRDTGGGSGGFGGVRGVIQDRPDFSDIRRSAIGASSAMNVYSSSVRQAQMAHTELSASTMVARQRLNNMGRTLRLLRGQTLGYFFSILFTTMSLERVRQAQRAYNKALEEHGKNSEEAKNADEALANAKMMLKIQFVHIGIQMAMSTAEVIRYIKTRALDNIMTVSATELKKREISALIALNAMLSTTEKTRIKNVSAKVISAAATRFENQATVESISNSVINIAAGEGEIRMINKKTASIWGQVIARRALLTSSVVGIGLLVGGLALSGMFSQPKGLPSMDDLPSFQTFSGESKRVTRDMPIFAHAGEVVSRESTVNTNNKESTVIMNNTFNVHSVSNPKKIADEVIDKQVKAFRSLVKV